jgi:hypothetical protein
MTLWHKGFQDHSIVVVTYKYTYEELKIPLFVFQSSLPPDEPKIYQENQTWEKNNQDLKESKKIQD